MDAFANKQRTLQNVQVGDLVLCSRHGIAFFGTVTKVKESSVIVKLSQEDAQKLDLETPFTVVSHKNYVIKQ
ncbi:hypothetical protein WQ57_07535 [Mesobacillus campisalis]|uniref:DUF2187 domain-containing protein n=1 Tax=Mesobacillus campisalis TaxID=1408103 RepID=A0A0M2SZP1_9BACI|nr:DUF2187 family protein [Mesobacillus campisalis]KKK38452.1 hypothetical protein WQ57_07535 [Mesobacillus campisalis]